MREHVNPPYTRHNATPATTQNSKKPQHSPTRLEECRWATHPHTSLKTPHCYIEEKYYKEKGITRREEKSYRGAVQTPRHPILPQMSVGNKRRLKTKKKQIWGPSFLPRGNRGTVNV
jgi:hypothetical protein